MIKVEIACNGWISTLNAMKSGADRIELFENLAEGGCTPSAGMIQKVMAMEIPCYVMIRPRGGDFCYSADEIDIMLHDIEICKTAKVDGIVFGCLTQTGEVDKELNSRLMSAWNHGPATFHRAIDRSADILKAAKVIVDLGFERILSSGGSVNVMKGLEMLRKMQDGVGNEIVVMPGAGVTSRNAKEILDYTGCSEIHATCKKNVTLKTDLQMIQHDDQLFVSDADEIALLVGSVK